MLLIFVERKIDGSMRLNILYIGGWRSLFSNKIVAVASFFLKIGGGSQYLVTKAYNYLWVLNSVA